MYKSKSVNGIILAAGNSVRFGKSINKNFELLNNKHIILYSIEIFNKNEYIDEIFIVIKEEEIKIIKEILKQTNINKPLNIVIGGKTRQESVYNALIKSNSNIIVIHDGARPLIKNAYINSCIKDVNKYKGSIIGVKSKDTIKISKNNIVSHTTCRDTTWIIQTPQVFIRKDLLNAHIKYKEDNSITDDSMLMEKEMYKIKINEGNYSNIKITNYEDLKIAEMFLDLK